MQKFILRRVIKTIEKKEVKAENFEDAVRQLHEFEAEPLTGDSILMLESCNVEYIGDAGNFKY